MRYIVLLFSIVSLLPMNAMVDSRKSPIEKIVKVVGSTMAGAVFGGLTGSAIGALDGFMRGAAQGAATGYPTGTETEYVAMGAMGWMVGEISALEGWERGGWIGLGLCGGFGLVYALKA
jgi:hypothetical protein